MTEDEYIELLDAFSYVQASNHTADFVKFVATVKFGSEFTSGDQKTKERLQAQVINLIPKIDN